MPKTLNELVFNYFQLKDYFNLMEITSVQKMNNEGNNANIWTDNQALFFSFNNQFVSFQFFFLWQRYGTMTRLCLGCIISEDFKRRLTNFNFSHTELVLILMIAGNIKKVNNLLGHVRWVWIYYWRTNWRFLHYWMVL